MAVIQTVRICACMAIQMAHGRLICRQIRSQQKFQSLHWALILPGRSTSWFSATMKVCQRPESRVPCSWYICSAVLSVTGCNLICTWQVPKSLEGSLTLNCLDSNVICFRDGMSKEEWAFLVAVHSDCWLVAVAFYFGFKLNAIERWHSLELVGAVVARASRYHQLLMAHLHTP